MSQQYMYENDPANIVYDGKYNKHKQPSAKFSHVTRGMRGAPISERKYPLNLATLTKRQRHKLSSLFYYCRIMFVESFIVPCHTMQY